MGVTSSTILTPSKTNSFLLTGFSLHSSLYACNSDIVSNENYAKCAKKILIAFLKLYRKIFNLAKLSLTPLIVRKISILILAALT